MSRAAGGRAAGRRRRGAAGGAIAAGAALLLAACVSERPDGLTGPDVPADCRSLAGAAGVPASHALVGMRGFAFVPARVEVDAGGTVTWVNCEPAGTPDGLHTATADDGSFGSSLLERGETFSLRFESSGTHPYFCSPHPFMRGEVVVD